MTGTYIPSRIFEIRRLIAEALAELDRREEQAA